jgi:Sigma-70 region 2
VPSDVVQDAFLGLHRALPELRDKDKALAYLRASVVNGCRSQQRTRRRAWLRCTNAVPGSAAERGRTVVRAAQFGRSDSISFAAISPSGGAVCFTIYPPAGQGEWTGAVRVAGQARPSNWQRHVSALRVARLHREPHHVVNRER